MEKVRKKEEILPFHRQFENSKFCYASKTLNDTVTSITWSKRERDMVSNNHPTIKETQKLAFSPPSPTLSSTKTLVIQEKKAKVKSAFTVYTRKPNEKQNHNENNITENELTTTEDNEISDLKKCPPLLRICTYPGDNTQHNTGVLSTTEVFKKQSRYPLVMNSQKQRKRRTVEAVELNEKQEGQEHSIQNLNDQDIKKARNSSSSFTFSTPSPLCFPSTNAASPCQILGFELKETGDGYITLAINCAGKNYSGTLLKKTS